MIPAVHITWTTTFWEEIRKAIGKGTRSVLWGTSTRSLNKNLKRLRKILGAPGITRFEVIDHTHGKVTYSPEWPRSVVAYGVDVELSWQDDGRTLKVFLARKED